MKKSAHFVNLTLFPLRHSDTKRGGRPAHNKRPRRDYCLAVSGSAGMACQFRWTRLTMRSMFDEPVSTREYLENYGAFMIHCGITGLGAPGPEDNHSLHGELPNAPFNSAWLEFDTDKRSTKICGSYQHIVAFSTNYLATIETTMKAESALLDVSVSVENLKQTPMDLMYLGHANFRPVNEGELHYSAFYNSKSVRVRQSILRT